MWRRESRSVIVFCLGLLIPVAAAAQTVEVSSVRLVWGQEEDERSLQLVFVEDDAGAAVFGRVSAPDRPTLRFIEIVGGGPLIAFMEQPLEQLGEHRAARLWSDGHCVFAEIRRGELQQHFGQRTASWMWLEASPEMWQTVAGAIDRVDAAMVQLLRLSDEIPAADSVPTIRDREDVPTWAAPSVEEAVHRHRELAALFDRMAAIGRR
jgi:hypothetical protein